MNCNNAKQQTESFLILSIIQAEVNAMRDAMNHYVDFTRVTMTPLLNTKHTSEYTTSDFEREYDSAMGQYRLAGEAMIKAIDNLSKKLNQIVTDEVEENGILHSDTLTYSAASLVVILSIASLISWLLASYIVAPIRNL
jgi:methyl-accepting chemotaxis protein